MSNLLLLLAMPEKVINQYHQAIGKAFPDLTINVVDHFSKVDPFIGSAEILVTFGPMLGGKADEILGKASSLKWIQALGTGVDNLADVPSLRNEVVVTNIHGIHGAPVSEAALMSMLAMARDFPRIVRNQDKHAWERRPARLLDQKTVGILGVGVIAEALAPKCKAMGMQVVGISSGVREVAGFDRMVGRDDLLKIVPELDFLVLLTPYSEQTRNIINAPVLSAMKPTAYLVNLARGGVVDEPALIASLQKGEIAGATLDVFVHEPLPAENPLWDLENVIITPHLGGFCDVYPKLVLPVIEENIRRFLAGDTANMINLISR